MAPHFFVELIADGKGFTDELRRQGLPCLAWRGAAGRERDLLRSDNQRRLLEWARGRRLLGASMTPPAQFWRRSDVARGQASKETAMAPADEVRGVANTELVKIVCQLGAPWAIQALQAPALGTFSRLSGAQRLVEIRGTRRTSNDA